MPLTSSSQRYGYTGRTLTRDESRGVFGQVMGLVALTFGCLALGAVIGRNLSGGTGFLFALLGIGCVIGLNFANARGREQLAIGLLFGLGLCFGLAFGPILAAYASADPGVVYQAGGATAGFIGILGCWGYATRRDLQPYYRVFFWALIALIVFGLVAMFVSIPGANVIYCILGLLVFAGFTAMDFQRLRRADMTMAVPLAASIFLDIFNVFILFLSLFGGGGSRR